MISSTPAPCAQCPFRKGSLRGYLGPWESPEELLLVTFSDSEFVSGHGHPGFVCHMTINNNEKICAGSLHCANKSMKLYRDQHMEALQASLPEKDAENVMTSWEFTEYHGALPAPL